MNVQELLKDRQAALQTAVAAAQAELDQIARALEAIGQEPASDSPAPSNEDKDAEIRSRNAAVRHSMPVNDAIVLAVGAGNKSPTAILAYVRDQLGVKTTINSVRARVSPLKADGRIAHDGTGWIPVEQKLDL